MTISQLASVEPSEQQAVLISIRSRYVRLILSGAKTYELRKRIPRAPEGRSVVVYSSGEDKAITAQGTIARVVSGPPEEIWSSYSDYLGVTSEEYSDYFRDSQIGYALELTDIEPSKRPLSLSELRDQHGIEPPQSWRYLSRTQHAELFDSL